VQRLYTLFDTTNSKPYLAGILDSSCSFIPLYQKGTGLSLYEIEENKKKIVGKMNEPIILNNFKNHIEAFGLSTQLQYDAYTYDTIDPEPENLLEAKKIVAKRLSEMSKQRPVLWQSLLADASVVYQALEERGIYLGADKVYPKYGFTITGRSKTTNFNIQGTTDESVRLDAEGEHLLIHLDWMGADIRAACILSGDEKMDAAFRVSDPYTVLTEILGDVDREDVKIEFLKSLYSLDHRSPVWEYYPEFQTWMRNTILEMDTNGYSETILGRRTYINDNRKTVFNFIIQGTVAHAMQCVLTKLYSIMPDYILTEIHDSIVLSCPQEEAAKVIRDAAKIMLHPFEGIFESNPAFPTRISIGKRWRKWKKYKELRDG